VNRRRRGRDLDAGVDQPVDVVAPVAEQRVAEDPVGHRVDAGRLEVERGQRGAVPAGMIAPGGGDGSAVGADRAAAAGDADQLTVSARHLDPALGAHTVVLVGSHWRPPAVNASRRV
jgi:hypothetical protein